MIQIPAATGKGMKINTRLLKTHPLLALIPTFTLRRLVAQSELEEFPKGTTIYRTGQPCEAIYLVVSGRCESRLDDGEVEGVFGPGDALGSRELLNHEAYCSTVTVLTHCVVLRLSAVELQRIFAAKPSIAGRFSQTVSSRFKIVGERRKERRVRRIVSLLALSSQPPHRLEDALASALHTVAAGRILLVNLVRSPERIDLASWARRAGFINGSFCFSKEVHETHGGFAELHICARGDPREPEAIAPLLSHLGVHFDYVLLRLAPDLPPSVALECIIQSDLTYLFLHQTTGELYDFQLLTRQLNETHRSLILPVLYLKPGLSSADLNNVLKHIGRPVHEFVHDFPEVATSTPMTHAFHLHLTRLAREIARCRIGIALSSGGAKGLAHVGVAQVLEENGIEVDVIAGSSMGAYVGALWAFGANGYRMERIARELESSWGLLHLIEPALPPRQGFLRSGRVARRLRRTIGNARFSELARPLRVIATHLDVMDREVFSSGEVAQAVEASIAIPGICVPVTIDGETYIDGGIADPLPVDVLEAMGVERIIAVNCIPTPEHLRDCEAERNGRGSRSRLTATLNRHFNYFARGNLLDTMFRSIHGVQMRVAEAACRDADVVLWTVACDGHWHDFTNPGKYINLGRKVAEAQLSELKALVKGGTNDPKPLQPVAVAA